MATRGVYQFVLQPVSNDPSKRYLVINYTDSLKGYFLSQNGVINELPVIFSGVSSPQKETVYHPDPTDVPTPAYDLPTIRLTALRRK